MKIETADEQRALIERLIATGRFSEAASIEWLVAKLAVFEIYGPNTEECIKEQLVYLVNREHKRADDPKQADIEDARDGDIRPLSMRYHALMLHYDQLLKSTAEAA
jgi:hypothetical protein